MTPSPADTPVDRPAGIDPRGPRFAAGITAALLLVGVFLALIGSSLAPSSSLGQRVSDPAFVLFVILDLLFLWGYLSPRTAPWGALFRVAVRPRLAPPTELEDPRPPRFAQIIGFSVVLIGLLLHIAGVPWALPVAGAAAFLAAFLNAAFAFCLGCRIYLALTRVGAIRPRGGLLGT
jgi:hypothetical protein